MAKKTVAIGFLGTTLDSGKGDKRWHRWRPTVAACMHEDLVIDRYELLYDRRHKALAQRIARDMWQVSPETEVNCVEIIIDDPWDFEEVYGVLFDFAQNYSFMPEREDYLINITTGTHVAQICMFLMSESHHFPAKLMQVSPSRGHLGPGTYQIIDLDLSKYDLLASRFASEKKEGISFLKSGIETRNQAFNVMIDEIEQVAIRSTLPVLLMGPTGAGKSQLASRIYDLKQNRHQVKGRFVEVNCATLRGDSAMSALFGHKRGAFTGAQSDRAGLLKSADKGVLFLDEIGELGLDEQAMMLRAIEDGRFMPVGADQETESRFQLIAGTNKDLGEAVLKGDFREDLYARLNLWTFHLPGLAERREDIEPNLDYEIHRYARQGGDRVTFNKEARERFLRFALSSEALWSANFRDLSAAVTRMATFAHGGRIGVEQVSNEIERLKRQWQSAQPQGYEALDSISGLQADNIDLFDQAQLEKVIHVCRNSKSMSEAGRILFAVSRKNKKQPNDADRLRKYLNKFGLTWPELCDD
ncbi:RNA repair transcriptional activator RtcR [Kordiimonas sp. SCSIO 12610]|uniref:RNA repair transcriptional activator RtcR n=1 Tax=Kordiimonas sp. SCSIO 12610 TaxID=2829597 RepID=UPI00210F1E19|nr:RNA repair transcriptional activator RtcR [Kordiimonas sp. SCSIO 12610]UTW54808.1 RNA repair transcriptional activator RtcR [Kordiimonas sp. SCSIO 12610]